MAKTTPIKSRQDYVLVAESGKHISTSGLVLQVHKSENPEQIRLGLTVSKKVGNAVQRNRVKRRLRNLFNEVAGHDKVAVGYDYVVIGKKQAIDCPYEMLKKDLLSAVNKISATI